MNNYEYYKTGFSDEFAFLEDKKKVIIQGFAPNHQAIKLYEKTFICCYKNKYECILLHQIGIPQYPEVREGENLTFLLIFEGLPEDCELFHLQSIPTSGTWKSYDFEKDTSGVYNFIIEEW